MPQNDTTKVLATLAHLELGWSHCNVGNQACHEFMHMQPSLAIGKVLAALDI